MDRIVRAAESADVMPPTAWQSAGQKQPGVTAAVTHAARVLADDLGASAIAGITQTGFTAELLSKGRGRVPVFAFSPSMEVCRRLALWWGVTPVQLELATELETNIQAMERYLVDTGVAAPAETVVITGSHPFGVGVHTNFVEFHVLTAPAS
jgi:pyruvate kinase